MKTFQTFTISHFERDEATLQAHFHYHFDNEEFFEEVIDFRSIREIESFPVINRDPDQISHFLSHIHIALGVSYYKLFPCKEIIVETIILNQDQQNFWHDFYIKGLGEFFYRNQLDPRGLGTFINGKNAKADCKAQSLTGEKSLVFFGGGKDSLVSVELLKAAGQDFDLFSLGQDFPLHQLAQKPTGAKRIAMLRHLDMPQLKKLWALGYYNGHVPITGTICFIASLVCYLYGYKEIITSLEKSADFGNVEYLGLQVNHQRSKSREFQDAMQAYFTHYLASNLSCQSLIRDRYEIKVVQTFAQYPQYFEHFSSCNRNFHQAGSQLDSSQLWCGICPKCTFIYALLRAFLPKEQVNAIFGVDIFQNPELTSTFKELLGLDGIKPFECVGTNEEVILAFWLIWQKEKKSDSAIMDIFLSHVVSKMQTSDFASLEKRLLN